MKTKTMIAVMLCLGSLFTPSYANKRADYKDVAQKMLEEGMRENNAYKTLSSLLSLSKHRLAGSPGAFKAVKWAEGQMKELGLSNVHTEPVEFKYWERGTGDEAKIVIPSSAKRIPLNMIALGRTVATPAGGITAEVIEVKGIKDLESKGELARGKIVFYNGQMNPAYPNTFDAYREVAGQRGRGAKAAGKFGAVGVVVRSLSNYIDDHPHTGITVYDKDEKVPRIPAIAISTRDADTLSKLLRENSGLKIYMNVSPKKLTVAESMNVVGEIKGDEKPNEIILIGAHIDTWDLSEGAHDNGSGCAHVLEALRIIKELGLKPKRTIRGVLFMDEEGGGRGGEVYAASDLRKTEKHIVAIESDSGGFRPLEFNVSNEKKVSALQKWVPLIRLIGMYDIRSGEGGVDIEPLEGQGTTTIGLVTDSQQYFKYHHSAIDTLDKVDARSLESGAVSMALFSYVLAEEE